MQLNEKIFSSEKLVRIAVTAMFAMPVSFFNSAHAAACVELLETPRGAEGEFIMKENRRLKISAIQFPIRGAQSFASHLKKMRRYLDQAVKQGAGLVVFPELAVLDLLIESHGESHAESEAQQLERFAREHTAQVFEIIRQWSRETGVAILGGTFPRVHSQNDDGIKIRNTAILALPNGDVHFQDKLHLTPDEKNWKWQAGDELKTFDAPWGRTVILICYDSQFAELSHLLSRMKPEMILVPSMTGSEGYFRVRWASQARAIEHHAFVVVTGTVDARSQREYVGQAAFITPQDSLFPSGVLSQGKMNRPGVVTEELDFNRLRKSRENAGVYSAKDHIERKTPVILFDSSLIGIKTLTPAP